MKFCKCVEQPQDYEKLVRLIEGGQELAAMDRINQMLAKTPNAAWLLALKGELAIAMQEIDTFKETANRFLKLKPDNPLALIMKSLACSLDGEPVENSANYLLEGMSESREALPGMTPMAIGMLIQALASTDKLSLAGYWADLQQMLLGEQADSEESILRDPSLNLLAKVPAKLIEDAPGAAWKERLAEVLSLVRIFRFSQAESKLRAILRDFPDQPGPLSHLLRAQVAQLNQSGAHATARKLSEHLEVPSEDRAYYAAIAMELEPGQKSLHPVSISRYGVVDSIDRIAEQLIPLGFVNVIEGERADQLKGYYAAVVQDEVPAKRIFSIFDRDLKPTQSDSQDASVREIASSVATVVLFGKQTDKPARALLLATRFPPNQSRVDEVLDILQIGEEIEAEIPVVRTYAEFLARPRVVVGRQETATVEENGPQLVHDFLELPFAMFDGATPREAAKEERLRGKLLGLLCHLEGEQGLLVPPSAIDSLYTELDLQRPATKLETSADGVRLTNILDLDRIDLSKLSDAHLTGVTMRAMNIGANRVFYRCILEVRSRESLAHDAQLQLLAVSGLRSLAASIQEKVELSHELIDRLAAAKLPVGKVVVELVSMLHMAGDSQAAQKTMSEAVQKYPEDPYLLSFLQHIMQQQQAAGGGSDDMARRMLQHGSVREESGDSGLVLPGQSSAAPQGESKLWLPGS